MAKSRAGKKSIQYVTLAEIREAAEKKLTKKIWDYFAGGAETEATLEKNKQAMSHYEFVPRVLRDVSTIDISTTFLGMKIKLPVMIAPMASLYFINKDADAIMARAAGAMGTIHWLSTRTSSTPEAVAKAARGPLIFQLFFRGDNVWCEALLERVEKLGYKGVALTVDTPIYGRRHRDLKNRFNHRTIPRGIDLPMDRGRESSLTWKDVAWLRKTTKLPLIIKGIQCAQDARLAIEHGANCIYVSNHGGRQLDFAPATIDVLQEVIESVGKGTEVIVDGGFEKGTDVLKALVLGAKAVCIGKSAAWGLAAGAEEGVINTLELFGTELKNAMANTGQASITHLERGVVRKVVSNTM